MTRRYAIGFLALLSGCASFSERPVAPSLPAHPAPLAIELEAVEEAHLDVGGRWIDRPLEGLVAPAAEAIWRSGLVRAPREDEPAARLALRVRLHQSAGPGLLPLLTAFAIPGVIDHHVAVELELARPDGPSSTCRRSFDQRTWYQTLLVLVYPFRAPAYARSKACEAMALECLVALSSGGSSATRAR